VRRQTAAIVGLLLISLLPSGAVTRPISPTTPYDSYGNVCWENEKARLDNFAVQLLNHPDLTGQISVSAGRISCKGEAQYRAERAKKWVIKRGVPAGRVVIKYDVFKDDLQTILILKSAGAAPSDFGGPSLAKNEVSIRKCVGKVFEQVICPDSR
jgi:hypothetical protein